MVKFLSEKVIRTVGIVGGTHGNERVGLELVRQWTHNSNPVSKESFRTILAVGNPEAASHNRRFVDAGLFLVYLFGSLLQSLLLHWIELLSFLLLAIIFRPYDHYCILTLVLLVV